MFIMTFTLLAYKTMSRKFPLLTEPYQKKNKQKRFSFYFSLIKHVQLYRKQEEKSCKHEGKHSSKTSATEVGAEWTKENIETPDSTPPNITKIPARMNSTQMTQQMRQGSLTFQPNKTRKLCQERIYRLKQANNQISAGYTLKPSDHQKIHKINNQQSTINNQQIKQIKQIKDWINQTSSHCLFSLIEQIRYTEAPKPAHFGNE